MFPFLRNTAALLIISQMKVLVPIEILEKLKGAEVELLSHGKFMFGLSFVDRSQFNVYGRFKFAPGADIVASALRDFPLLESELVRLLGASITDVHCDKDGTITLKFTNDDVLVVDASYPGYDSYIVAVNGREYRV
jgi:hypothetical protein